MTATARHLVADRENDVFLNSVSSWEIAPLPLEETVVLQLAKLPEYHRDPFDRMLVCQVITHGLTILTPDPAIGTCPVPAAW